MKRLSETLTDAKSRLAEDEATDGTLCESLLEQRCGMGLTGLCDFLAGVIRRRLSELPINSGTSQAPHAPLRKKAKILDNEKASKPQPVRLTFACQQAAVMLREAIATLEGEYDLPLEPPLQDIFEQSAEVLGMVDQRIPCAQ